MGGGGGGGEGWDGLGGGVRKTKETMVCKEED